MKSLNIYISEGLADWSDDELNKKIDKQTSEDAIKQEITDWIVDNTNWRIYKNKLKFDFDTNPITVDYDSDINFKTNITSLTNGIFQWGYIGGGFSCEYCRSLKTLEGAPKKVRKGFSCESCNSLKSLKGAPKEVGGNFNCAHCKSLESLEGAPEKVGWDFDCENCKLLTSLKGAPKEVSGGFICHDCPSLESLEGAPKKVGKDFYCYGCSSLTSLEGAPKKVGGYFNCQSCGVQYTEDDVKKVSNVKYSIYC